MNSLKFTYGKWVLGMASDFEYKDNSIKVLNSMNSKVVAALEECVGELESQVKRNTRVDTGQLKSSWQHNISSEDDKHTANIGSPLENAIWEEFGTGEYALHGNGRKGGWFYEDAKGDGHFTYGKKPSRAFHKAYTSLKSKIIKHIQNSLKGL